MAWKAFSIKNKTWQIFRRPTLQIIHFQFESSLLLVLSAVINNSLQHLPDFLCSSELCSFRRRRSFRHEYLNSWIDYVPSRETSMHWNVSAKCALRRTFNSISSFEAIKDLEALQVRTCDFIQIFFVAPDQHPRNETINNPYQLMEKL